MKWLTTSTETRWTVVGSISDGAHIHSTPPILGCDPTTRRDFVESVSRAVNGGHTSGSMVRRDISVRLYAQWRQQGHMTERRFRPSVLLRRRTSRRTEMRATRSENCLRCGRSIVVAITKPCGALCGRCASDWNPPVHPHWLRPTCDAREQGH